MSLPTSPDTTGDFESFIKSEKVKVISFTAGAAYSQGDFHSIGSFFGVIAEDVANGATGSLIVEPGSNVYAETSKTVGVCTSASDSDDVFRFANFGYITDRIDDDDAYEIVAAGEHTMATADEDITISGLLATDIVTVSYLSYDTTGAGTLTAECEAGNLSITTTEATTGDGVVSYLVIRAAS